MTFKSNHRWPQEIEHIKEAGLAGASMAELADKYEVSRQRMKQVIDKYIPNWKAEFGWAVRRNAKNLKHKTKWGNREDTDLYRAQRMKFRSKKTNATKAGYVWGLEFGDLEWPTHCPILGIRLDYFTPIRSEASPSFDQVDPGKGYVTGNIVVMSWRANRIKNDGTAAEHHRIADWLDSRA